MKCKMLKAKTLFMLLIAVPALADSPRIIETENGYVVEYSGTPIPPEQVKAARIKELRKQVESLSHWIKGIVFNQNDHPEIYFRKIDEYMERTRDWAAARTELAELTMSDSEKLADTKKEISDHVNKVEKRYAELTSGLKIQTVEKQNKEDEVTVAKIQPDGYEVSASGTYLTYRIKVDIENKGKTAHVFLTLNGLDGTGNKVESILMNGIVPGGQTTTLRGSTFITSQQSSDIKSWVVESANAYKK